MLTTISQQLAPLVAQLLVAVLSAATLAALTWIRQRVRSRLAADALSLLTSTAATLVAGAAEEVRSLKDPLQPGSWDEATAQRIRDRVVRDLRTLGAGALGDLKRTQGLDSEAVHRLLTQTVEAQVEALRRGAPVPPQALAAEALRGTDPPRAPAAPQAGYARPGAMFAVVVLLWAGLAVELQGCPRLPPVSGCTPTAQRCGPSGHPEVCSASQRWEPGGDVSCAVVGGVCVLDAGVAHCAPAPSDGGAP